ncbi:protein FAR1-RELATED SEQUENCE 5-like [Humulus lupulus]|uniref:protein FAR1-RELATED SEQUENCE 5-like n=1 Tax=Humulus lupulus TaxID=3486 RepID=UPI002B410EC1|nr:protein FAR1-RELATED SEQUENCE 5-like [Humulus lupulus]
MMNLDVETGTAETKAERVLNAHEEVPALEPCIGMEFESEEAAKEFYDEYSRRVGFVMRIDQCRRSEVDKRILSRRLSCNKQGFSIKARDEVGHVRKQRSRSREGCKAMMLVKVNKSGKWAVTRFEKDHTHPLVVSDRPSWSPFDSKDRKIEELTMELEHQDQLCESYRELLLTFLKNIEEQTEMLSTKIRHVVNNIREVETEGQKRPQKR